MRRRASSTLTELQPSPTTPSKNSSHRSPEPASLADPSSSLTPTSTVRAHVTKPSTDSMFSLSTPIAPRPPESDYTSTRALSRFLRATGPPPSGTPKTNAADGITAIIVPDPSNNRSPSLKSRKSRNFASAAKSMGKESLALFRRKRHVSVSSTAGIGSEDPFMPPTSSPSPSPLPESSGVPKTFSSGLTIKAPELPAIFRSLTSKLSTSATEKPSQSLDLSKSPAFTHPKENDRLSTTDSFDVELDEYMPARISIDGALGDFRPSPVVPNFQDIDVSPNGRPPEAHLSTPGIETTPSSGDEEEDDEEDENDSSAFVDAQSASSMSTAPPKSAYKEASSPLIIPPASGQPTTPLLSTLLAPSTPASTCGSPRAPPLSPPPSIPLPRLPSVSSISSHVSILAKTPPREFSPASQRAATPIAPPSLPPPSLSSSAPSIDDSTAKNLQEQILVLSNALSAQRTQMVELSTHILNIVRAFDGREQWFRSRVECLEKEKWSWEKEREGLRWLLAVGQAGADGNDAKDEANSAVNGCEGVDVHGFPSTVSNGNSGPNSSLVGSQPPLPPLLPRGRASRPATSSSVADSTVTATPLPVVTPMHNPASVSSPPSHAGAAAGPGNDETMNTSIFTASARHSGHSYTSLSRPVSSSAKSSSTGKRRPRPMSVTNSASSTQSHASSHRSGTGDSDATRYSQSQSLEDVVRLLEEMSRSSAATPVVIAGRTSLSTPSRGPVAASNRI